MPQTSGPFSGPPLEQTWNRLNPTRGLREEEFRALAARGFNRTDAAIIQEHLFPQLSDQAFNEAAGVTLAASATRSTIVSFQIPQGCLGILRSFATAVQNGADWGNIRWALALGGHPVLGYDNMLGPISDILYPLVFSIPVFQGQLVKIVASNLTAKAISNVTGAIRGSYFPAR